MIKFRDSRFGEHLRKLISTSMVKASIDVVTSKVFRLGNKAGKHFSRSRAMSIHYHDSNQKLNVICGKTKALAYNQNAFRYLNKVINNIDQDENH